VLLGKLDRFVVDWLHCDEIVTGNLDFVELNWLRGGFGREHKLVLVG
jgi:hypothetical protein